MFWVLGNSAAVGGGVTIAPPLLSMVVTVSFAIMAANWRL
jgi:hypothetical protein